MEVLRNSDPPEELADTCGSSFIFKKSQPKLLDTIVFEILVFWMRCIKIVLDKIVLSFAP